MLDYKTIKFYNLHINFHLSYEYLSLMRLKLVEQYRHYANLVV